MLFTGYSEHTIDSKLRLAVPAKHRNLWSAERDGGAWMCIPWPTGHLRLYTENYFHSVGSGRPATVTPDQDTAELEARLFSLAERLEMDSAGRIMVPKRHLEWTGLKTEVAIIGARDRLEVHDLEKWNASAADGFRSLPALVEKINRPKGN